MLNTKSKLILPVASFAFALPAVIAEDKKEKDHKTQGRIIKPSKLPIYEDRKEIYNYEYHGKEKTKFQDGITIVRKEFESVYGATQEVRESVNNFVETGKAHSLGSLDYVRDKDNLIGRIGFISVGAVSGLLLGIRRGFFRKILLSSLTGGAAAALCYPNEAKEFSKDFDSDYVTKYGTIAYNFVAGVKPKDFFSSKTTSDNSAEPKEELKKPSAEDSAPKTSSKPAEQKKTREEPKKTEDVLVERSVKKSSLKIEGDFGQGNPADKDMYTTRGG